MKPHLAARNGARPRSIRVACAILGLILLFAPAGVPVSTATAAASPAGRFFEATGKTLAPEFTAFYDRYGGVAVFGYPIDEAHQEGGYLVQYCERERLEYHPENAGTPYEVLLGRLGGDLTVGRAGGAFAPVSAVPVAADGPAYIPQTQHRLGGPFLAYWQAHGGVTLFGYPISEEFVEDGLRQQWFERARFEYHPELPPAFRVTLGLLGSEMLAERARGTGQVTVSLDAPRTRHLELGLAQGGESRDSHFFSNVVPLIAELHVPLIRLDNIYTFYDVVHRDAAGGLAYDWRRLDTVVDDIRAMGAEPLLCLSYTPPALSPDGTPIQPPRNLSEWQTLVRATVTHFNVDRKLGIRYWEIWNEPDQWDFWRGSWPGYLDLYDASRQAIRAVDPQARVGGPARQTFDAGAFNWFLGHQQQVGPGGGVEFLSWHAYGLPAPTVLDQIGTARNVLARYPGFTPELAITEFNVLTGGDGDTSSEHRSDSSAGAAYVLAMLDAWDRAGLDRAFLFEVKDGYNAAGSYWGRWGITTYDGRTKPIYHALRAYQALGTQLLPVQVSGAGLGALAAAPGGHPHLLVWNNSYNALQTRITLPPAWSAREYAVTLFDAGHNNPQASNDDQVRPFGRRSGHDLAFTLAPGAVMMLDGQ
ncbi:MAG TPA: hypothetical protein VFM49_27600 [Chloroflexia bacterium]|nr:hypothetical protein [Chloroflexia bacterium]